MKENLRPLLAKLKLRGLEQVLDAEIERAQREGSPIPEVIYRLLVEEDRYREERSLDQRLKRDSLGLDPANLPFESKPELNRSQIQTLVGLSFVERAQNVVFIGDPGTGKPDSPSVCSARPFSPDIVAVSLMPRSFSISSMLPLPTAPRKDSSRPSPAMQSY